MQVCAEEEWQMKVAHFADVHLGMTNFGWLDTASGLQTRILDFLDALDALVEHIERIKPDLALFAGDAFKTRTPSPTLSKHFADRMQRIADVCPLVMLVGNHDRQRGGEGKRHSIDIMEQLISNHPIHIIRDIQRNCLCVGSKYELVNIFSIPWVYDAKTVDVVERLYDEYDDAIESIGEYEPVILLAHVSVEGAMLNDSFTTSLDDEYVLPIDIFDDFDYAALGHIHKHQSVAKNAVYAGSIERIDWGERNDDKGFVLVTIEDGNTAWEFISLNPRPMVEIRVGHKDIKSIGDIGDDSIVRVDVDASASASEPAIIRAVKRQLDNVYLIDAIKVIKPSTKERRQQETDYADTSPADMLDRWIEDHIEDDDFGDKVFEAGLSLMEEVEEEMI
jgi:exonuclease SbcD